jgi:hypothetical protein
MRMIRVEAGQMPAILIALLTVILSSCGEDYGDKEERLVNLVAKNPLGDSDYWLELRGDWTGEWYKVGLIFGFGGSGDYTVCQEIADDQNSQAGGSTPKYRCVAAN